MHFTCTCTMSSFMTSVFCCFKARFWKESPSSSRFHHQRYKQIIKGTRPFRFHREPSWYDKIRIAFKTHNKTFRPSLTISCGKLCIPTHHVSTDLKKTPKPLTEILPQCHHNVVKDGMLYVLKAICMLWKRRWFSMDFVRLFAFKANCLHLWWWMKWDDHSF